MPVCCHDERTEGLLFRNTEVPLGVIDDIPIGHRAKKTGKLLIMCGCREEKERKKKRESEGEKERKRKRARETKEEIERKTDECG